MSPRLTEERKEERGQQILDAAKRVFARKGYGAATLKDIIEETGMSRGWIYLYYQTKEEIFEAVLDQMDMDYEQSLEHLKAETSTIWQMIETLFARQQQELEQAEGGLMSAFYEYFLVGWRYPDRREVLTRRYERGIERFAQILQTGVSRGEFVPAMPVQDISRLVASFQEGIVAHTHAVGATKANTALQLKSLLRYLGSLLQRPEEEAL
ncbi:TetR family transcriptional regulator [Paenibacillus sp. NFR01]|uniref:TetR family transcriptional regulator n=1 Tax=Paenibacillus sp. NFR01 TaxID=1566279 RepID=UPI0008BEA4A4|nr:TetR family transcriptional regulator [Paenibacillus sp. NFR01]SET23240.1 transcriptional regulator, TetR family [Paenibacillus sp. NFR01]